MPIFYKGIINFTFSLSVLLLLSQCKNEDHRRVPWIAPITKTRSTTSSLFGTWSGGCCLFYSSELKLSADSTFTFHDQGCTQQCFTKGRWKLRNDIIVLTSDDRFKQHMTELTGIKDTLVAFSAGPGDTTRIYFDRQQLQITRDTLYGINSNNSPKSLKFYRASY